MLATKARRRVCNDCRGTIIVGANPKIKVFLQASEASATQSRCESTFKLASKLLLIGLCYLSTIQQPFGIALADDSAAAPAFDMSALASLASNLGSNPQIMSMVSSLLNSNVPQKPGVGSLTVSPNGQADLTPQSGSTPDQDPNSIVQQDNGVALRRGARQEMNSGGPALANIQQQQQQQQAATVAAAPLNAAQPAQGSSNSLNGLLSMMPSVLSSLTSGGTGDGGGSAMASSTGSLGPLNNILGLNKASVTSNNQQVLAQQQPISSIRSDIPAMPENSNQSLPPSPPSPPPPPPPPPPAPQQQQQQQPGQSTGGGNPAQSVINQVLTAYASGQIPNELIQLGLSGRVPPQIIEMVLSGQVPPQIVQMVITGQVPMSTINTFLNTIQPNGSSSGALPQAVQSTTATNPTGTSSRGTTGLATNMFATTRALFEALFGLARNRDGQQNQQGGIVVPTLLGAIPLRMPSMPNVRSLGQMVGGTITNVASMIPF